MKRNALLSLCAAAALAAFSFACGGSKGGSGGEEDAGTDAGEIQEDSGVASDAGDADDAGSADAGDAGDSEADGGEEEFVPKPVPAGDEGQLESCFVPSEWPAVSFDKFAKYKVTPASTSEETSYEFQAYDEYVSGHAQTLWVEIYPADPMEVLTGTFDLSAEPLDYGTCTHCVVIDAAESETSEKYYMPVSGTLKLTEVSTTRIEGTLTDVTLAEVRLTETAGGIVTTRVENGCSTHIASMAFAYAPPELPAHVAECFIPEVLTAKYLTDYIYGLTTSDGGYCYETIALPGTGTGMPYVDLFIEAYEEGTGTFELKDCVKAPDTCTLHSVLIEATMSDGSMKTYMADSGTMTLTALSKNLMEGELENVHFIETNGERDIHTPKPNSTCTATLGLLSFSSKDAEDL